MISQAIAQNFKSNSTLVDAAGGAERFFAESGQGDQSVVVSVITPMLESDTIPDIVTASSQVLCIGYGPDAGEILGQKIIAALNELPGATMTISGKWTYKVQSVNTPMMPVFLYQANTVSINFTIVYRQTFLA